MSFRNKTLFTRNAAAQSVQVISPGNTDDGAVITAALALGGLVQLQPGTYTIRAGSPIRITTSDNQLEGLGVTQLFLENEGLEPCIYVGTKSAAAISRVRITGLRIDGNRTNQSQEESGTLSGIKNNCIEAHNVNDLVIEDCFLTSGRSGGITLGDPCKRIFIKGVHSTNQFFDGFAFDGGHEEINLVGCVGHNNDFAGLSLDTGVVGGFNVIGCHFVDNAGEGIFMRQVTGVTVSNCVCRDNTGHGIFLAQASGIGPKQVTITGCWLEDNGDANHDGLSVGFSNDVTVSGCTIKASGRDGIQAVDSTTELTVSGCTIVDNTGNGVQFTDVDGATVTGCTIRNNGANGVRLQSYGSPATVDHVLVSGCNICNNTTDGVSINESSSFTDAYENVNVTACNLHNNGVYGFDCDNATDQVKFVTFQACNIGPSNGTGNIRVQNNTGDYSVFQNAQVQYT